MPNAPSPPSTLSFTPPTWSVQLQKDDTTPISDLNEVDYMRPLEVHFGVGTQGLPRASFQYDLAEQEQRIVDQQTPTGFSRQMRIVQDLPNSPDSLRIFEGDVAEQDLQLGSSERAIVMAQLSPFHFGSPLYGPRVVNSSGTAVDQNTAIVFNPKIDNVVTPNMNKKVQLAGGTDGEKYYPWVSPESCRTTEAIAAAGNVDNQLWTLDQIVCSLCWICNPDETYVKNPTLKELTGAIGGAGVPEVKNIGLHRGHYLPQILDELLRAFGCAWTLSPRTGNDNTMGVSYVLKVFQLGTGVAKDVLLQRPGSSLTRSATNTRDVRLSTSISEMFNVISAHGALKEYEFTAELYRGWPESEDKLSAEDLDSTTDGANKDNKRAWRWWVLNEGGDFTGTRTTVAPIASTFTFSGIFDTTPVPKRRKFLRCISFADDTLDKHDKRRKPYLQYYKTVSDSDGAAGWTEVPSEWGPWQVHEHMCAIQFTGDEPPDELIALGDSARLRITASVADDVRITATASRQDSSPNGRDIVLFLDVSDRFFKRTITATGTYASIFNGQTQEDGSPNNDARDDSSLLTTFANSAQQIEDAAIMRADITIAGINVAFKVSDLIRSVNGRNVSFNRKSAKADGKSYPQVYGITYDWTNQATILDVRPLEEKPTTQEVMRVVSVGSQNVVAGNAAAGGGNAGSSFPS